MKKRVLVFITCFMLVILMASLVVAADKAPRVTEKKDADAARAEIESKLYDGIESNVIRKTLSYFTVHVFGIYNTEEFDDEYDFTSVMIFFVLIWLILFVGISDILFLASPFSSWTSWIFGFAISVIGANLGFVQWMVSWMIYVLAGLGMIAIFIGIGTAFIGFIALSFGANWAIDRKAAIEAHRGRADIATGMRSFAAAGREAKSLGNAGQASLWKKFSNVFSRRTP